MLQVSNVAPTAKAQTATTEWLLFNTGEEINITATEENLDVYKRQLLYCI